MRITAQQVWLRHPQYGPRRAVRVVNVHDDGHKVVVHADDGLTLLNIGTLFRQYQLVCDVAR